MASTSTNNYQGRVLTFSVSETSDIDVVNNKRKVNWSLTSSGGSSTYYSTFCISTYIDGTCIANYGSTDWSTHNFPAAKGTASGSFWVSLNSYNASKSITISITGGVYYGYGYDTVNSSSLTVSGITVTAPTAPTSLTLKGNTTGSTGIIKKGETIRLTFTGGTNGTNNPITKYIGQINSDSSRPEVYSGYTFTASNTAGTTYKIRAYSKGTRVSDSSWSSYSNTVTVNTPPRNPTISDSDVTIEATASAPSFTITNNGDVNGQTVTLYYNWSNSHTGQSAIASGGSITIDPTRSTASNTSKTLYVWAWDGLEYSSVVTRTVTRKKFTPINFNGTLAERTIVNGVEIQHLNFNGQDIF